MQKDIPEIEQAVRLFPRGWDNNYYVRSGDKEICGGEHLRADSSFFDVFTIPFKTGKPQKMP